MILVTGATGNIGGELVKALVAGGHGVRALVRDPSTARLPAEVELVTGDLNKPRELSEAFTGVDSVFLMAGYPDPPALLTTMHGAGVRRVVLLSTGAVVGGDVDNFVVRFNLVSEAAVRDSPLEWTVLRPSGFMSNTVQWQAQLQAGDVVNEPFGDVPIAVIDPFDIAAVAALVLTEDGHAGQSYRLTGPEILLPADRLKVLADLLDRDLALHAQPDDEARAEMLKAMPEPLVDAFFRFFRAGTYDDAQLAPTVERLLGRPARTFETWAEEHLSDFG